MVWRLEKVKFRWQKSKTRKIMYSEFTWWVFLSSSSSSSIALFNLYCFSWQTSDPIMLVLCFKSSCLWTTYYSSLITTLFKQSVNQKLEQSDLDFEIYCFWIFPTCVCGSLVVNHIQWITTHLAGAGLWLWQVFIFVYLDLYLCTWICICVLRFVFV